SPGSRSRCPRARRRSARTSGNHLSPAVLPRQALPAKGRVRLRRALPACVPRRVRLGGSGRLEAGMGTGRVAARWGIGVAGLLACGAAGADGPASDPVEIRLLDVGDLTQGNADFLPDRGPFGALADQ